MSDPPVQPISWSHGRPPLWRWCLSAIAALFRCVGRAPGAVWSVTVPAVQIMQTVLTVLLSLAAVVMICVFAALLHSAVYREQVTIAPFSVPKELSDRGYTDVVAAQRLRDVIGALFADSTSMIPKLGVAVKSEVPEVVVPTVGVSVETMAAALRAYFNLGQLHQISGDITYFDGRYRLRLRIDGQMMPGAVSSISAGDPDDLLKIAARAVLGETEPYLLASAEYSQGHIDLAVRMAHNILSQRHAGDLNWLYAYNLEGLAELDKGRPAQAEQVFRKVLQYDQGLWVARLNLALALKAQGKVAEAVREYDRIIAVLNKATDTTSHLMLARTLLDKGAALAGSNDTSGAMAAYRNVVTRFDRETGLELRTNVAAALIAVGNASPDDQSIAYYDDAVRRFGLADEAALREQVALALIRKGLRLKTLGKPADAIKAFDDAVARFGADAEPELRRRMAAALVERGNASDGDDAVAAYQQVVSRFGDDDDAEVQGNVAIAMVNQTFVLIRGGHDRRAIAAADEVVARFGAANTTDLRVQVAQALVNKDVALGNTDAAIAVDDDVVARFGAAPEPGLRLKVAIALLHKEIALRALGRYGEAVEASNDVVRRYGDAAEPELREQVADALVAKSVDLLALGKNDDAIAASDAVLSRYGTATEPALRDAVANALLNKGAALANAKDAVAIYQTMIGRFADATELGLREKVAKALWLSGGRLGKSGDAKGAIAAYDSVVTRFGTAAEESLREWVSRVLLAKSDLLGNTDAAIAVCDDVVARFGGASEFPLLSAAMTALEDKGKILVALERRQDAMATWDELVRRFATAGDPRLQAGAAQALRMKADSAGSSGQAIAIYDDVLLRFGDSNDAQLRSWVAIALYEKGNASGGNAAIAAYDELISRFNAEQTPMVQELVELARSYRRECASP